MKQSKGIVGFQISSTDMQASYKLSQTRQHDHPKIFEELQKTNKPGSLAIASCMKHLKK